MKFSTVLALAFLVAAVSAAPQPGRHGRHGGNKSNREDNSRYEDNSNSGNKKIDQGIGSVGSTSNGLLGGALGGANILGKTTNTNKVGQSATIN